MALNCTTNINIDFYDKKYILLNAKQFDKKTRFLSVTCYNHGELFFVNEKDHVAYIRYKKSDDYGVFNFCTITKDGKILVELTEQMLASSGICIADLVLVNRGQAKVDAETGEITNIVDASILSTMTFNIDVSETVVDNAYIESSYEYSAFNQSLETYWADFEEVMQLSKSYAIGDAGGIRPNENTHNSMYYYQESSTKATAASNSATAANESAGKANESAGKAAASATTAKGSEDNAETYMKSAESHMISARESKQSAANSATSASESKDTAGQYMSDALGYRDTTLEYMKEASEYKDTAYNYSIVSQRYAVGGTDTVEGEDKDNSKYYYGLSLQSAGDASKSETVALNSANAASDSATAAATSEDNASTSATAAYNSEVAAKEYADMIQSNMDSAAESATNASTSATAAATSEQNAQNYYLQAEAVVDGLNGAFLPKGTITFAELAELKESDTVAAGHLYNISDNFTTDESFRKGVGIECDAGVSVYYTVDGQWDILASSTVVGVKGIAETTYRKGNVELSAENVGAIPVADIATVDEIKTYLGI